MTIIYRTTGAWGVGKGSPLTKVEGDSNIYQIVTRVTTLESSLPAAAVGISSISVTGDQMSIILSNATTEGPFTLPTIINTYRGAWAPSTPYNKYDRFTNNGNLYEVLFSHTSGLTFNAAANDGLGHNYYQLILSNPGATFPTGGVTGAFLVKASSADFDFALLAPGSLAIPFTAITGVATPAQLPTAAGGAIGGVKSLAAVAHKFLTSIGTDGLPVAAQPDFTDLSGIAAAAQIPPTASASISSSGTLDITQANKYLRTFNNTPITMTVPPTGSVAWVQDTEITFRVTSTGSITIAPGSSVTINTPTGFLPTSYGTGATLTIKYVGGNQWDLFGLLAIA